MNVLENNGIILASRTLVALLLIGSGAMKLFEVGAFVGTVRRFALLPDRIVPLVANAIPIGEALTGALLLLAVVVPGSAARWAAIAALGLFAVFAGAVAINLMRGRRDISCGCFGAKQEGRISWFLVVRNCVLGGISYLSFHRIYASQQTVIVGERLGSLLIGLSTLLIWHLATVIARLGAHNQDQIEG